MSKLFGFFAGVGLGTAGAWWFLQPQNAQKVNAIKKDISVKSGDIKHKAEDLGEALKHRATDVQQNLQQQAEELKTSAKHKSEQIKKKLEKQLQQRQWEWLTGKYASYIERNAPQLAINITNLMTSEYVKILCEQNVKQSHFDKECPKIYLEGFVTSESLRERLNTKLRGYFTQGFEKVYERVLESQQNEHLTEFYVMFVLNKLNSREQLMAFMQTQKRSGNLKEELLLDCLWSLSLYLDNPLLKQLNDLIIDLSARSIIDKAMTFQLLTEKTLAECKFVDQGPYSNKVSRIYTRMNLWQNKFNLIREANEGYSKVSLLLISLRDNDDLNKLYQNIVDLIGNFDLDPDRVIDLILEGFIQNHQIRLYVDLLKKFERSSIPPILCQRLLKMNTDNLAEKLITYESVDYFLSEPLNKLLSQEAWTPNIKLMRIMALLMKNQLIKFEQISNSLTPSDKFFEKDILRRLDVGKAKFVEAFMMTLDEGTDQQKRDHEKNERTEFFGQFLYSSRLWLMCELVAINDWNNFYQIWFLYSNHIDLITHQPIMRALFRLLDWSIEKVYKIISYSKYFKKTVTKQMHIPDYFFDKSVASKQVQQVQNISGIFFDQVENILSVLKSYIGFHGPIFIKLCRIFRKLLSNPQTFSVQPQQMEEYRFRIRQISKNYLVPGVCAQKGNPSLENQLYPLLMLIEDFRFRYDAYLQSQSKLIMSNPYFCYQHTRVKKEQNVIFNTLSVEKKKQYIKRVGKICNNHSFYVFYWVITKRLISDTQKDAIPEFVAVLVNCTKFALDVLVFIVLHTIVQNRNPINFKTLDIAAWYRNCFTFLGLFYRKYPQTDLLPTINYVMSRLNRPIKDIEDNGELESIELKVLKEVIGKMTGISIPEEISKNLLMIMASGPKLQSQTGNLTSDLRPTKKSKSELQTFIFTKSINWDNGRSLAFFMLVLMAQKRTQAILKTVSYDVKLLAEVYDEYTTSIVQLIKVLTLLSSDYQQYAKLLPKNCLKQMILHYKIPIELAFHIFRNSIKNTSSMAADEWAGILKEVSGVVWEALNEGQSLTARGYTQNASFFANDSIKDKFKKSITYELYSSFWLLNLDSIYYPQSLYDDKIDELKKKIAGWRVSDRVDKELDKTKTLLDKIVKESEIQKKKYQETMEDANKHKILISRLSDKRVQKTDDFLTTFAEMLSQTCILPRLLLEPRQALYCAKFVLMFIKANQLYYNRCVKLINSLLENVMMFLPFSTHRESICISVFVSELLQIFANWNDPDKLKNDFLTKLGTEENMIKDNYAKMKDYLLKLFQRVVNCIKNIKEEPYIIKNALYLLDKLEVIPAYRQQAEDLELYIMDLKKSYGNFKGINTLLDRQISMLIRKKNILPDRPLLEDKKSKGQNSATPPPAQSGTPLGGATPPPPPPTSRPAVYAMLDKNNDEKGDRQRDRERQRGDRDRQREKEKQTKEKQKEKEKDKQRERGEKQRQKGEKQRQKPIYAKQNNSRDVTPLSTKLSAKGSQTPSQKQEQKPVQTVPSKQPIIQHKQSRQIRQKTRFTSNSDMIAAHLNPRDVEKGQITAAVDVTPTKPRTVKQAKEQRLKSTTGGQNSKIERNSSQLQPDQKSEGEIKEIKDTKEIKEIKDSKDNKDRESRDTSRERQKDSKDDNSFDKHKADKNERDNFREREHKKSERDRDREDRPKNRDGNGKDRDNKDRQSKQLRDTRQKQIVEARQKARKQAREIEVREKQLKEREARQEKEAREKELREREVRQRQERQARERDLREKELREAKQREAKQREAREKQAREKLLRQQKQKETNKTIKAEENSSSKQDHSTILKRIKDKQNKKDDPSISAVSISAAASNLLTFPIKPEYQSASHPNPPSQSQHQSQPFSKDHSSSSRRDDRDRKDDKREKDDRGRYDKKDERIHDNKKHHYETADRHRRSRSRHRR